MKSLPNIVTLITDINAINQAWKEASDVLLEPNAGLATSLRDLKNSLQIRLLRNYPEQVYLVPDDDIESEEPVYSLCLREPVGEHWNAAHIPVRVAEEMLTADELTQFVETVSTEE